MEDVIVVGAGPAGSTTAEYIRRNSDKSVVVLEKGLSPDATCAGGISKHMVDKAGIELHDSEIEREIDAFSLGTLGNKVHISKDDLDTEEPSWIHHRQATVRQEAGRPGNKYRCRLCVELQS